MQKTILFIIGLICQAVISQEINFLSGSIISDEDIPINITNVTQKIGTINDERGFFRIKAVLGDTIVFSSVRYQQKTLIVAKEDLENPNLNIQLEIKVNELDEVRLSLYALLGKPEEDIGRIKTYGKKLPLWSFATLDTTPFVKEMGAKTIRNTVIANEMDKTPVNLIAVGRMVTSIFKNKNTKKMEVPVISDFYKDDFIISELEIKEVEIYDFKDFLNENQTMEKVLKSKNKLEILEFLLGKSEGFKAKYRSNK